MAVPALSVSWLTYQSSHVHFSADGEPSLAGPPHVLNTIVCQVVPFSKNPYVVRFGEGAYHNWVSPNAALVIIKTWCQLGWEVVIHSRRSRVQSVGESLSKLTMNSQCTHWCKELMEESNWVYQLEDTSAVLTTMVESMQDKLCHWNDQSPHLVGQGSVEVPFELEYANEEAAPSPNLTSYVTPPVENQAPLPTPAPASTLGASDKENCPVSSKGIFQSQSTPPNWSVGTNQRDHGRQG
ncbi:hypothetical protein BJ322DRAFT_1022192 [Thelephora terrestris]|uniref:Uncharacterized protein n=1 Tax=Thelephora terrestris TaxID=56493 RepID=A0A9P6L5J4_9AGAM|nr:hypothetical protein BJ322DRAFT_1022192 [Thelephora terrestris]